jgi:hypothetical protein
LELCQQQSSQQHQRSSSSSEISNQQGKHANNSTVPVSGAITDNVFVSPFKVCTFVLIMNILIDICYVVEPRQSKRNFAGFCGEQGIACASICHN